MLFSVARALRRNLDAIFWRQYADEIHLHPEAPFASCLLGMTQVWLVLYALAVATLAPVIRGLRFVISVIGVRTLGAGRSGSVWFTSLLLISALVATMMSLRLYWKYRLTPDRAARLEPNEGRDDATLMSIKLIAGAMVLAGLMIALFW